MTKRTKDFISFAVMVVLVFIVSQFLLCTSFSFGPHFDVSLGWLDLHLHGYHWHVGEFNFGFFMADVVLSVAFTWVLSRALRKRTA
jgi:hypothetical protein